MAPNPNSSSGAKPSASNPDDASQPYKDDPVPSYETAIREGAGGGIGAGPSSSSSAAPPTQPPRPFHPSYGCSPYTPHGTARIVIVPAPHFHHPHPHQHPHIHSAHAANEPLLPLPASMDTERRVPRAKPRFFLALLNALLIYILINLLVDLTVTRKW
ncbi:hypothetical protein NDA16_000364 [Ustilago loliicola]|nr:hypothetical protein NDA16_000364 [Ustilago loliicola]